MKYVNFKSFVLVILFGVMSQDNVIAEYNRYNDSNLKKDEKAQKQKEKTWWEWIKKNKRWIGAGTIGAILAASKGIDLMKDTNNGIKNSGLQTGSLSSSSSGGMGAQQHVQTLLNSQKDDFLKNTQLKAFQLSKDLNETSWYYYLQDKENFEKNYLDVFGKDEKDNLMLTFAVRELFNDLSKPKTWNDMKIVHKFLKFNVNKDYNQLIKEVESPIIHDFLKEYLRVHLLSEYNISQSYYNILKENPANEKTITFSGELQKLIKKYGDYLNTLPIGKDYPEKQFEFQNFDMLLEVLFPKIKEKLQEKVNNKQDGTMQQVLDEAVFELLDEKLKAFEVWLKDKKII